MELDYFDWRRAVVIASATGGMNEMERSLRYGCSAPPSTRRQS